MIGLCEIGQKSNLQVASFRRQISMNCLISDTSIGIFASRRVSRAILAVLVPFLGLPVVVVLSGTARVYPKAGKLSNVGVVDMLEFMSGRELGLRYVCTSVPVPYS